MLCHRGCGLPSTYTNYKGLGCCSKITQHCPIVKEKIKETLTDIQNSLYDKAEKIITEKINEFLLKNPKIKIENLNEKSSEIKKIIKYVDYVEEYNP